jgi:hypothetical protein
MSLASRRNSAWYLLAAGVLLGIFFNPEDGGNTFSVLHGIIAQKIELFN